MIFNLIFKKKFKNLSPWLDELNRTRQVTRLKNDYVSDVAIVGGGIAGLSTAYFLLKHTTKKVVLIEAGKIGHGATGHNAGQVVDYFERPFSSIVDEFGLDLALQAQRDISSAWDLLQEIIEDTGIAVNFKRFVGYAGCSNLSQLISHLKNKSIKSKGGIEILKVKLSKEYSELEKIPKEFLSLIELVEKEEVLNLLETTNQSYFAALQSYKGCLNSAFFSESLCSFLLQEYKARFAVFEHSPVSELNLYTQKGVLKVDNNYVSVSKIVLCTNGFENFTIKNLINENIDKEYHSMIYSRVGYMTGYLENKEREQGAISYLQPEDDDQYEPLPYFYLTRRDYRNSKNPQSLVCIGGPEKVEEQDSFVYKNDFEYPESAKNEILNFLNTSYKHAPKELNDFNYYWHGLMGYTKSGIRIVGEEPLNNILLYNLGCNGIGILPSIFGGRKIARHINQEQISSSVFDPIVQRNSSRHK